MYPVLLNIGNFPISSFGFFLSIGIFFGGFVVWRIARGYELDAEKILDLGFLTVASGFIASRVIYILTNLSLFDSLTKAFFLNRYPGLSFWGGFLGGLMTLNWLAKKNKISFLQAGDFAVVGFFLAAFFTEIGCLLGACGVGIGTHLFFGIDQLGAIGKRIPIQIFEALIFLVGFLVFWKTSLKFHIQGSLLAKGLILTGLIKLLSDFFKAQSQAVKVLNYDLNLGLAAHLLILGIGLKFYYQVYKKTPLHDLKSILKFFSDRKTQSDVVTNVYKGCYNHWVNLQVKLSRWRKRIFKLFNIRSNPESF